MTRRQKGLIHRYTNEEKDVFLREINVNEVTEYSIFMTHDSDVVEPREGTDVSEGEWFRSDRLETVRI